MRISIKYKILTGIFLLLSISTALNSYYSYTLIAEDKRAYIFENTLDKAESLMDQSIYQIQSRLDRISTLVLLGKESKVNLQKVINNDDSIYLFAFRDNLNPSWNITFSKDTKTKIYTQAVYEKAQKRLADINMDAATGRVKIDLASIEDESILEISFKDNEIEVYMVLGTNNIKSSFLEDKLFSNFLFNQNQLVYGNNDPKILKALGEVNTSKVPKGTKTIQVEGEDYLVSFVSFKILGLKTFSLIQEKSAFAVVRNLIQKTTFFGVALLGLGLIGGVFYSRSVTKPLKKLMEAVSWVSEESFDNKVEIRTRDEFKDLGDNFNYMSETIDGLLSEKQQMIEKLEDYSQNLEKMVAERTKDLNEANENISSMVNSLDQGLLMFGPDTKCLDVSTKACEDLFGVRPDGKFFYEVLGDPGKEGQVKKWADVTFQGGLPFSSAKGLAVQKKVVGEDINDPDYRHIEFDYFPMFDEEEKLKRITLVATDKTNEMKAIESFKEKEAYVEMIVKLVKTKKMFKKLLGECDLIFKSLEELFQQGKAASDEGMMLFHTLNGGFGTYSVYKLQQLARNCEQVINDKNNGIIEADIADKKINDDYGIFVQSYKEFKEEIDNIFEEKQKIVEVDFHVFKHLEKAIVEGDLNQSKLIIREYIKKVSIIDRFSSYKDLTQSLATQLGKKVYPLRFIDKNVRIRDDHYEDFFQSLVHLFRNCMDHGIEKPTVRKERGKEEVGTIEIHTSTVKLKRDGSIYYKIIVTDDGGGIDPVKVREKYLELNPGVDLSQVPDKDVIYKIFDPNFSTAEQVTTVSGRGIGMSAIKDIIDKYKGRLVLKSIVGKGSYFEFWLPVKVAG